MVPAWRERERQGGGGETYPHCLQRSLRSLVVSCASSRACSEQHKQEGLGFRVLAQGLGLSLVEHLAPAPRGQHGSDLGGQRRGVRLQGFRIWVLAGRGEHARRKAVVVLVEEDARRKAGTEGASDPCAVHPLPHAPHPPCAAHALLF